jgi:lipopolysaccharide/colanic/teichoic acid biosynthesis glycosyltransferase
VFFRQQRLGVGMKEFTALKFRTMKVNTDSAEHRDYIRRIMSSHAAAGVNGMYKLDRATAITKVGGWLRKTSLDELPQLLNVVRGDMSLVGPRPVRPSELPCYGELLPAYLSVRPGLTGLWQVSGRSEVKFPRRAELDADYSLRCSARLDLAILMATPGAVLRGRGAE